MWNWLRPLIARIGIAGMLIAVWTAAKVGGGLQRMLGRRRRAGAPRSLLVTGTFYNIGWYRSHIPPLARCKTLEQVLLVSDIDLPPIEGVTQIQPPKWVCAAFGQALARIVFTCLATLQHRPDVIMGYHIMPNGLISLALARLSGAQAIFQLTGGPVQLEGGGYACENIVQRQLRRYSRTCERWLYRVVREFDCVVTRGELAIEFLNEQRLARRTLIIPGSVDFDRFQLGEGEKLYDLVCVARHVPVKRYDRLLAITAELVKARPTLRLASVGGGVLLDQARAQAQTLGITDNVAFLGQRNDVPVILAQSRTFILTSDVEGLSIAMLEAMAAGLPAFVPDIGDLGLMLSPDENGRYFDPDKPAEAARRILEVLNDNARLKAMSAAARAKAEQVSIAGVAARWDEYFQMQSGAPPVPVENAIVGAVRGTTRPHSRVLTRKNLWQATPAIIKHTVGRAFALVPQAYLLGHRYRTARRFVSAAARWPAERARAYQLEQLRRVTTLAYDECPYYRAAFTAVGFDPRVDLRVLDDLRGLPTIDKATVRHEVASLTTRALHRVKCEYVTTGGSSGEPLGYYINTDRSPIEYAYLTESWGRVGYRLDATQAVFAGHVIAPLAGGMRRLHDPILRRHYYSNFHMNDAQMSAYLEHMRSIGPCYLQGYPSAILMLTRYLKRTGTPPPANVLGLLAGSERVCPRARAHAEALWGVRYFAWYGHSEKLVLAAECEHNSHYHVWPTYGYFELIDEDGQAVTTPGQRGEIVGTGFINRVTPFIRYRTGDYAEYVGDACPDCGREHVLIRDIDGRWPSSALVMNDGTLVTTTAINVHDNTFDRVERYQFHQRRAGEITVRVVPTPGFTPEDGQRILTRLSERLGQRAKLQLELPRGDRPDATWQTAVGRAGA